MATLESWIVDMEKQALARKKNIEMLRNTKYLDEDGLRKLDSTLKKVTTFIRKLKNIGSQSAVHFMPDLDKLNLSKYLDEIAKNICEAKVKTSDLEALIAFCVKLATLYKEFPSHLIAEFRKQMPNKKNDQIKNASKLRVDLRFFGELLLSGLFDRDGLQLLGAVLSFLVQTDRQEHLNASVLLPFCRALLFPITGTYSLQVLQQMEKCPVAREESRNELLSSVFNEDQRNVLKKLLNEYWDSLVDHANRMRLEMNKLRKSIKRQERTRGDASADDRQKFETAKVLFERLTNSGVELGECLGREMPEMVEEPSDDEREEAAAKKLEDALTEGKVVFWPNRDTQLFYESLVDVTPFTTQTEEMAAMGSAARKEQQINESIDNVDLSCLEEQEKDEDEQPGAAEELRDAEMEEDIEAEQQEEPEDIRQRRSSSPTVLPDVQMATANFNELLEKLPHCINRELIDAAALELLKHYARNKSHRKRLVQHFVQAPVDRLDLLPFYTRFLATLKPAYPDIAMQVMQELLSRFKAISEKSVEMPKKAEVQKSLSRTDSKLHLCAYLAELCKFGVLPKAEALTILRSLLVNMKWYKVDMLCVLIESMGQFLYRSPDAHAKMSVIMQVMRTKSENVKDSRQKILLENAYFAVIPPEEPTVYASETRLPPLFEFVQRQLSTDIRLGIFRRLNWDDEELSEFTLKLLSRPHRAHFDDLARIASLISSLTDHIDWIGVRVLDEILEFIRLSMELNSARLQQQAISSVAYLGQLFNYNVCNTVTLFKVLYQLITFGIPPPPGPDHLVVSLQRIRLVHQLVGTVCEFFVSGKAKRRMDHFLYFFLRFYYETREGWSEHFEELDEFPEDVGFAINDLLSTWRKGEKFPKALSEACEKIVEVEEFYRDKVEEVLASIKKSAAEREAEDGDGERRLKQILEEDEEADESDEEDEEESEEDEDEQDRQQKQRQSTEEAETGEEVGGEGEEDQIRVHIQQQKQMLPEDEEFLRDFDRVMTESLQSAPVTLQGPMSDLTVPPLVRQKFERKLTFVDSSPTSAGSQPSSSRGLLPAHPAALENPQKMALMLRGGPAGSKVAAGKAAGVLLKAVQIEQTEGLHEKWRIAQEERERDRKAMKRVTLAMNARMTAETESSEPHQQQSANLERKFTHTD